MRIVVTGGAGFIGSHFVRQTLTGAYAAWADAQVVVVDKLTYAGNEANLVEVADSPRLRFVRGDICDGQLVGELLRGTDLVVHFAAESHVDRSISGAEEFVRTNVLGTHTLLNAVANAGSGNSSTFPRTRSTAPLKAAPGARRHRWSPTRRIPRPRHPPICWPGPSTAPMDCPSA